MSLYFALSSTFSALANVYVARKARELNALHHQLNREDAQLRFLQDIELRKAQFAFSQNQVEQALITRIREREEDANLKSKHNHHERSFEHLKGVLQGSPDGLWLHDPYATSNPGIKSLRVLFQKPIGMSEVAKSKLEHSISQAITQYSQCGDAYPIHFPTGFWKNTGPNGSWLASELHAWDQSIPTLILRMEDAGNEDFWVKADLFGFALGKRDFAPGLLFGKMENKIDELAETLPALVLATADIYFLHTYGKIPLLPAMLNHHFLKDEKASIPVIKEIVEGYSASISNLAVNDPQLAIHVALNLAEAFIEFPDKAYALIQLQRIEEITKSLWLEYPELSQRLKGLYLKMGNEKRVAQISELLIEMESQKMKRKVPQPNLLKDHI